MVYGLISDVHGNLEALHSVLAALSRVERLLCLGDIVGYGPNPGECLDALRERPDFTCVAGNHDLAAAGRYDLDLFNPAARAAILWTQEALSAGQRSYLASLPMTAQASGALLVHGSLPEPMEYITGCREARRCFEATDAALCLVGHTHVAEHYRLRPGTRFCEQVSLWSGGLISLQEGLRQIVNVGAVGQPRDGNPQASFGVWDTEAGAIEVRRVAYDVEAVQAKMRQAGLPRALAERLAWGR